MTGWIFSLSEELKESYEAALGTFAVPLAKLIDAVLYIAVIVIATKFILRIIRRVLKKSFERQISRGKNEKRIKTISALAVYVADIIVYFIAVCALLSVLGLGNTVGSLLATAGIGGIAVGFGAQSLIKDFLSGVFLIFEDQIEIGDFVSVAGVTGTVENIQLRTTKLRAMTGELHVIPNGEITVVTNYSRGGVYAGIDVPMPYENTVEEVTTVLEEAMEAMASDCDQLLEKPQVLGIVEFGDSAIMLRIIAKVKKLQQAPVERLARRYIIEAFQAHKIEIPYNKLELLHEKKIQNEKRREEDNGEASCQRTVEN